MILSSEDQKYYLKYLNIYRIKISDFNTLKKEKADESQSDVSKSDSVTLSLANVYGYFCIHLTGFSLTESYLHSFFSFNISLQSLLVTFLKGFFI